MTFSLDLLVELSHVENVCCYETGRSELIGMFVVPSKVKNNYSNLIARQGHDAIGVMGGAMARGYNTFGSSPCY